MQPPTAHLPLPEFTVDAEGTARSAQFDDVYFSRHGGVAETEHVFLAGNGLPTRWMGRDAFTIGELGFGTGLNFLTAWRAFEQSGAGGRLHFLSVEKYPLSLAQLREALAHRPELAPYAAQLLAQYPLRLPGLHRLDFGRVTLTLGFGDAAELLPQMQARVDAWFLDGFAPARNPDMWHDALFAHLTRLSAPDATFATFTVAGAVRRGLQAQGWQFEKTKGYGHKREMLVGRRDGAPAAVEKIPTHATVVGAGIAGATLARALAERGMQVTVLERAAVASGASGNPAAVLYPQLTLHYTPATAWHFLGYAQMLRDLQRWQEAGLAFDMGRTTMRKLPKDDADAQRLARIAQSLQLDPDIARWEEGGFTFAQGCWVNPGQLCRALLQHPNITLREHTPLEALGDGIVLLANAGDAARLLPLKLGQVAGQVSVLGKLVSPPQILCRKGYAIGLGDALLTGATYERDAPLGEPTAVAHEENLAELSAFWPTQGATILGGRRSLRATTPSRLPYVGHHSAQCWVSVGHGSRGMISAPLAAQVIAAQLCHEPLPITQPLLRAVSATR